MEDFQQEPEYVAAPPAPTVVATGIEDNVAGALAYVTIVPAILFLVLPPYNTRPFIRFHSFQCLGLAGCGIILSFFTAIPILGWIIGPILALVLFCVWILCVVKAYQGIKFKVPILGNFVEGVAK